MADMTVIPIVEEAQFLLLVGKRRHCVNFDFGLDRPDPPDSELWGNETTSFSGDKFGSEIAYTTRQELISGLSHSTLVYVDSFRNLYRHFDCFGVARQG